MGVALGAIADHGDFLALDEVDVGIPIVIDAHGGVFPQGERRRRRRKLNGAFYAASRPASKKTSGRTDAAATRPHISSGPRVIAATPVRATSTRPIGRMSSTNWSILAL